jgi:hypothetical protein
MGAAAGLGGGEVWASPRKGEDDNDGHRDGAPLELVLLLVMTQRLSRPFSTLANGDGISTVASGACPRPRPSYTLFVWTYQQNQQPSSSVFLSQQTSAPPTPLQILWGRHPPPHDSDGEGQRFSPWTHLARSKIPTVVGPCCRDVGPSSCSWMCMYAS